MSFQSPADTIDASRLDKRIQLQRRTISPAANGEQVETWATIRTLWAWVRPVTGRETFQADSRFADARFQLTFRYQPDICLTRGEHRFLANQSQWQQLGYAWEEALGTWEDRHLDILDIVNPNFQNTLLTAICQEWAI